MSGPQSRAERLIAASRLALALASVVAVELDPSNLSQYPELARALLGVYATYAFLVAVFTIGFPRTNRTWQLASHVIDLAYFAAVNLTFGPTTSFAVYFSFSIICGMLRFSRRGTIASAVASIVVFLLSTAVPLASGTFEFNRFIIRATYFGVLASMLVYLSAYQQRLRDDLERIAQWPRATHDEHAGLVSELIEESASIFAARRALLAYAHLTERRAYLGERTADGFDCTPQPPGVAQQLLAEPDLSPAMREQYDVRSFVDTPFDGDYVRGRLVLLDGGLPLLEEVNLARIAGGVIAGRLDHFHAAQRLQRGAVAEERVRVARDLHDSVLQSLTGVSLQLRGLPRLLSEQPAEGQHRFAEIERILGTAQKELRWFIDELRPRDASDERQSAAALADRLSSLAQRFREQWSLEIDNRVASVVHLLPVSARYEIYAIVNEAVANAAKHAAAKRVSVNVDANDEAVMIDVCDDGKGFPFHGRYELHELVASKRGPVTLKERVTALGGTMLLQSSEDGTSLEIRLPLRATGV